MMRGVTTLKPETHLGVVIETVHMLTYSFPGYITFIGNFIPLLQASTWADPVWVNVPGFLLGDAQVNAEYVSDSDPQTLTSTWLM